MRPRPKKIYRIESTFAKKDVVLKFGRYGNNRTSIELADALDGFPVMIVTVNVPDARLEGKEIIVKDYSENEGVLDFLQKNRIVSNTKRVISTGWVICPVVDLLVDPY